MNILARLWLVLTPFYAIAHGFLFVLIWRSIDLRLEIIVQHLTIPFLQSMTLAWVAGAFKGSHYGKTLKYLLSRPTVVLLWCFEAGLLLFWYRASHAAPEFIGTMTQIAALEGFLAVMIIVIRFFPVADFRKWVTLLPFILIIFGLGSNAIKPWFHILFLWFPHWPFLLKQSLLLGAVVIALLLSTDRVSVAFSEQSPLAGRILSWMQPLVMVAAMAIVLNGYLFAHLVSPWQQITAVSLSLAATCLLTSVLCLFKTPDLKKRKTIPAQHISEHSLNFWGLWFVMALSAFTCVVVLRIFWFPHWEQPEKTLLTFLMIPFVQSAWIRWAQSVKRCFRLSILFLKPGLFFSALLIVEMSVFGVLVFTGNFRSMGVFRFFVCAWLGIKLIILGVKISKGGFQGGTWGKWQNICGMAAIICGMGTALGGGFYPWLWMFAALGTGLVLLFLGCRFQVSMAGTSAEALLTPVLAATVCVLIVNSPPMSVWIYVAYVLMVFATSFMAAMGSFGGAKPEVGKVF